MNKPSEKADALIRASITPEARRVIRADVIAEVVAALRAVPSRSLDVPLSWDHAAALIERELGTEA